MIDTHWTEADISEFDRLTLGLSSADQMERISARLELRKFKAEHGEAKCEAMFEVLKERDRKRSGACK